MAEQRRHAENFAATMDSEKDLDVKHLLRRLLKPGDSYDISRLVPEHEVLRLCEKAQDVIASEPACLHLEGPLVVVGDLHGQYKDLLRIFKTDRHPPTTRFLFLGDYVDRGDNSIETICVLFCYKIIYPDCMYLLRGNHETSIVNRVYGFYEEVKSRYMGSTAIWYRMQEVFNWLPITAIVGRRILCMHGGLSPQLRNVEELDDQPRPMEPQHPSLWNDLMWSDPEQNSTGFTHSSRGISFTFGSDVVREFCARNHLDMIVRAHQCVQDGYDFFADRYLVTVFSAPLYCGQFNNSGATLKIARDLTCMATVYHPK